jgi:hypothetical protein
MSHPAEASHATADGVDDTVLEPELEPELGPELEPDTASESETYHPLVNTAQQN